MELLVVAVGWLVGALINWLADSLPVGRRPRRPRCAQCGAPRPWPEWVAPVRSSCAHCGAGRGLRPWLVHGSATAIALWLYLRDPQIVVFGPGLLVAAVFLLITVIDIEHRLILRAVVIPSAVVLGLAGVLQPERGAVKTLAGGLAGFVLLGLMYLMGIAFSRWMASRRGAPLEEIAFGYGDVMLGALLGLVVGWPGILVAVVVGVLLAGVFSLAYLALMMARRSYTPFAAIPYGPFLILGASLVYFGGRTALESILGAP